MPYRGIFASATCISYRGHRASNIVPRPSSLMEEYGPRGL